MRLATTAKQESGTSVLLERLGTRKWRSTLLVQGRAKKGTTAPKQVQVPPNTAAEV